MNIPNCINKTQTYLNRLQTFYDTFSAFGILNIEAQIKTYPEDFDFPIESARIELRIKHILNRSLLFVLPKLLLSPRVIGAIAFIPVALHTPTMIVITIVAQGALHAVCAKFMYNEKCQIRPFITDNLASVNTIDTIMDVAAVCLYLHDVLSTPCLLYTVSFGIIFYNSSTVHTLYQRVVEKL